MPDIAHAATKPASPVSIIYCAMQFASLLLLTALDFDVLPDLTRQLDEFQRTRRPGLKQYFCHKLLDMCKPLSRSMRCDDDPADL
jgi:hypothetical protein